MTVETLMNAIGEISDAHVMAYAEVNALHRPPRFRRMALVGAAVLLVGLTASLIFPRLFLESPAPQISIPPEDTNNSQVGIDSAQTQDMLPTVTQKEMVTGADLIIRGTLKKSEKPYPFNGESEKRFQRWSVRIKEVLKGTPYHKKNIEIRIDPNEVKGLAKGQEFLLILYTQTEKSPTKEAGNYYVPFRGNYGFFVLENEQWVQKAGTFTFSAENLKEEIASYTE
ncbi:MAG: hypothetical protein IJ333_04815 [Clostridia bacterium]|nr:hypothetical protein [Clostridia bacterium]